MRFTKTLLIIATAGWLSSAASAKDIRVAPSAVEPPVGARTATLTILNGESEPQKVQIRVMRWSEADDQEVLVPTKDLAASPPFVTLRPNGRYTVRLVRTAKTALHDEESYRILVDEVPQPHTVQPGTVNFVLRQSIPVFFSSTPNRTAKVDWHVVRDGRSFWLIGHNTGNRRLRISDVTISAGGSPIYHHPGLLGYVLAGSEIRWLIEPNHAVPATAELQMKAASDIKPIDVSLAVASGK